MISVDSFAAILSSAPITSNPYGQKTRNELDSIVYAQATTQASACLLPLHHPYSPWVHEDESEGGRAMSWKQLLAYITGSTDFFTAEVWTWCGLVTYYVLFFIRLGTREVHVAGVTPHPAEHWMMEVARNVTMAEWGFLEPGQYIIHDRDGKVCPAFRQNI